MTPVGPSAIPDPLMTEMTGDPTLIRELDIDEIQEIIQSFAEAAKEPRWQALTLLNSTVHTATF